MITLFAVSANLIPFGLRDAPDSAAHSAIDINEAAPQSELTSDPLVSTTTKFPSLHLQMAHDGSNGLTVGFYGGGMMAEAILRSLLSKKVVSPEKVYVCELLSQRRTALAKLGVHVTRDGQEMLTSSTVVIVAVKPDAVPSVLEIISKFETKLSEKSFLLMSICAGVKLRTLESGNPRRKCVRVMPNQPCVVGEAASVFTMNESCTEQDRKCVEVLMGACGLVAELPEKNLDAVTGLSGSGPAYVFMMIEAMADGGVRSGLPRAVARHLAAQTVLGAAKMALDSPEVHPAELRNRVESPSGTTIAGTAALEDGGFRSAVINAVTRATERSEELGQQK